jgi:hypothetical protein
MWHWSILVPSYPGYSKMYNTSVWTLQTGILNGLCLALFNKTAASWHSLLLNGLWLPPLVYSKYIYRFFDISYQSYAPFYTSNFKYLNLQSNLGIGWPFIEIGIIIMDLWGVKKNYKYYRYLFNRDVVHVRLICILYVIHWFSWL